MPHSSLLCVVIIVLEIVVLYSPNVTGQVANSTVSCLDPLASEWNLNPGSDGLNTDVCAVSELYPGVCFNNGMQTQVMPCSELNITFGNVPLSACKHQVTHVYPEACAFLIGKCVELKFKY